VDKLDLMHIMLGHMEDDVQVEFGELLLDVRDVRYSPEREAIVLLLHSADVNDVLRCPLRLKGAQAEGRGHG